MITTPLARHRSVAIFWWSLAVAFEGWLSLRVMLPWLMGTMVRLEGSFGARVMAGWDAAIEAWEHVPDWRQTLLDQLSTLDEWLTLGRPLVLALLTWLVIRRGRTAAIHLWAAGTGLGVIALAWLSGRVGQILISCPGCPGGAPLSWWETAVLVIPAACIMAGCLAGLPRTTIRTRPYRPPLPRWQSAMLAAVVLAAAGTYGYLNSGRLLGRCSYDWDEPSPYIPKRADEVKILGRGCDTPEFREQITEELRWLAEITRYRNNLDAEEASQVVTPSPTEPPAKPPVCPSASRPPAWRPPAPHVTARVDAAWRRIENWLDKNAPGERARLHPPATRRQIRMVEAALGRRLPDDLRASLLRHNGADAALFIGIYTPMSAALIKTSSQGRFCGDHDMLPFAIDVAGDALVVTRTGKVGGFSIEWGMDFDPCSLGWPSYPALLEDVATSFESGTPLREFLPRASAGGELIWIEDPPLPGRPTAAPSGPSSCAGAAPR